MIRYPSLSTQEVRELIERETSPSARQVRIFLAVISAILSLSIVSMVVYALSLTELSGVAAWFIRMLSALSQYRTEELSYGKILVVMIAVLVAAGLFSLYVKLVKKLHRIFMSPFTDEDSVEKERLLQKYQDILRLLVAIDDMKAFIGDKSASFKPSRKKNSHTLKVTVAREEGKDETKSFYIGSAWNVEDFISESGLDFSMVTI